MPELSIGVYIALIAVAFIAGFISAIAGGGGMIILPSLLSAGIPPINALATGKFQSVFGTLTSTINYIRSGRLNTKRAFPALIYAFIGACIGVAFVQYFDPGVLSKLLPFLLILVALYVIFSPHISDQDEKPILAKNKFDALIGTGTGIYGGFFGPGMGSFLIFIYHRFRGNGLSNAVINSKPVILITNTTAMVLFTLGGHVVWILALSMSAAQIVGAHFGAKLVLRKGAKFIKPILAGTTIVLAIKLLVSN